MFRGQGHLHIDPPTSQERHNLALMMQSETFDEDFDRVVLRFNDSTAGELEKASTGMGQPDAGFARAAESAQKFMRHSLHDNLDLRLLEDVLSPATGGFFMATIRGTKHKHLFFFIDPQGFEALAPEEVVLLNWEQETITFPLSFHLAPEYAQGTAHSDQQNQAYSIQHEDLDVAIEKNGF